MSQVHSSSARALSVSNLEGRAVLYLDAARCAILRLTMRSSIARQLFVTRHLRLMLLHSVWLFAAMGLASLFPLWILLLGPLIYGFPHLAASLRYFAFLSSPGRNDQVARRQLYAAVAILACGVGVLRLCGTFFPGLAPLGWLGVNTLEVTFAICVAVTSLVITKSKAPSTFAKLILLFPLVIASYFDPMSTVGALILIHNFVGYIYWIGFTRNSQDRATAVLSGLIFCGFNLVLFCGGFDQLLQALPAMLELKSANLAVLPLGASILPWVHEPALWHRAVVAYAFGQTMHYFVWLKAIPEQNLNRPAPVTFRQSWGLIKADFGHNGARFLILAIIGLSAIWLIFSLPVARNIYFSIAGFHGYLEIAGIALLFRWPWLKQKVC